MRGFWTDKRPAERFPNAVDWSAVLGSATITACRAEVVEGSVTLENPTQEAEGAIQTVWLSGGSPGAVKVLCTIETSDRRILSIEAGFNVVR